MDFVELRSMNTLNRILNSISFICSQLALLTARLAFKAPSIGGDESPDFIQGCIAEILQKDILKMEINNNFVDIYMENLKAMK